MPLNAQQKQAVEYLDGPLLVLAGPGTGKTQLLSSKVTYILQNTDTNPENILCLTFTESGAENMRTRLFSMIGQAASRVNIHTYHAFGSDILMAYKNYATEFDRILDSPIDPITQHKILREIQSTLPANDILRTASISDISETIASAKSARLTAADLLQIANDNLQTSQELIAELNIPLARLRNGMKFNVAINEVYLPIMEILQKYTSTQPIVGNIEKEANVYLLELNNIIEQEQANDKPSVKNLTAWKNKRFEKDAEGNYRLSNIVSNKKLLSLSNIMYRYDEKLRIDGLFDFADMIEEAIRALKNDSGFRATLSEHYQYILLDEFQDTNPSQAEIIRLLTDYDKPCVMAVGDDDQAIFEFQGANASNLLDFQEHYNAKVITLLDNYRSTSKILNFSHQVANQIETSFAKKRNINKKLNAIKDTSTTVIERHEFVSADSEYYWVANRIDNLIASGVKQSDIAIITPKHKYIAPLLPYLKSHETINISYEKRDNIFEEPAIAELLKLARFIYELSEEKQPSFRLLEILSFPFWNIAPEDAIKLISEPYSKTAPLELLNNSANPAVQQLASFFARLVVLSYDTPLELMLDYLIGNATIKDSDYTSPFIGYYSQQDSSYATFELYAQLSTLRSALVNHTKNSSPKLKDLIGFLDDYAEANAGLVSTSPYQDANDSIQIVTAHKSKGLEYEYVFLVATDNIAWGKSKGNNNLLTLPANLTQIRHTGITDDERLRLFFVAITRAKTHLYISNSIKDFSGKSPARLDYLSEYEDGDQLISPLLDSDQLVTRHYDNLDVAKQQTDLKAAWIANYQTLTPALKPILEKRVENYRMSATDLTSFIDLVYSGPVEFYKRKILYAPSEPASESIILGNLIHATFEQITNKHISDDEALAYFKEQALLQPLLPEDVDVIIERGQATLNASLKAFAPILRASHAAAEVNLSHEHLMLEQIPLLGKIDHINIDDDARTIEIYDFKTGNYHKEGWDSHRSLFKYKLQLCFYKLLLNLSPTYSKYKISRAHILFVVPDNISGEVYDKVYEYNDTDQEMLIELIKAVYYQIKTLDFVDNPELFLQPDKNKPLREIKEFIKLLIDINAKV